MELATIVKFLTNFRSQVNPSICHLCKYKSAFKKKKNQNIKSSISLLNDNEPMRDPN